MKGKNIYTTTLSYVSIISFVMLVFLRIILSNFDMENLILMKLYMTINNYIYIPLLGFSFFSSIYVLIQAINLRFEKPLMYFYLVIPSLLYFITYIIVGCFMLVNGKLI
ncbi:hypothetical protein FLAN108750_03300 [Flavobacterium antarcticum]